jgi:hypothetical protein
LVEGLIVKNKVHPLRVLADTGISEASFFRHIPQSHSSNYMSVIQPPGVFVILRLFLIRSINLVNPLHLGNEKNGGRFLCTEGSKQQQIWKTYSWPSSGLKFLNRSVITVLYFS